MIKKTVTIICLLSTLLLSAQVALDIDNSSLWVEGTSSLHNWKLKVDLDQIVITQSNVKNDTLSSLKFKIPVMALKAPKKLMKKQIRKALKATKFPMLEVAIDRFFVKNDGLFFDTATYTIAGFKKTLPIKCHYKMINKVQLLLSGTQKIQMTDFNMKPPSSMFGLMTAGNEVLVTFEFLINLENKNKEKIK